MDDWLMVTAVPLFYTGLVVCLNIIAQGGGSNLFPPEQFSTFTEQEIQERVKGSKIVIVSEQVIQDTLKAANMANDPTVHAECNMDAQDLHAADVRPYDIRNDAHEVDQDRCYIRRHQLGSCGDRLLYGLHAFQWLLGCPSLEPAVHNATALCHCPSDIQPQQRRSDHCGTHFDRRVADFADQAEDRIGCVIQHGSVCRKFDH